MLTATRVASRLMRMRLSNVVLPAPTKPERADRALLHGESPIEVRQRIEAKGDRRLAVEGSDHSQQAQRP
jgi:hypothetical protein